MQKYRWLVLSLFVLFFLGIVFFKLSGDKVISSDTETDEVMVDTVVPEPTTYFDIIIDSFDMVHGQILHNQTLGNLLQEYRLPEGSMQQLITLPNEVFNLRKIRAGNHYHLLLQHDSLQTLAYFIYEIDPVDYVVFHFTDSLRVWHGQRAVTKKTVSAKGQIETSLWNAMIDNGYHPLLANDLSDIYAWSIDFFGLQVGDSFSVVLDEEWIDTVFYGYGRIHAAFFEHAGTGFYAIPFTQDSTESYFDLEGKSLRKAFLKAPLKFSRISSGFSYSRMHPILKIARPHLGVDYAAPAGTPVYAIGDGVILEAKRGYNKGGGNMIRIKHNSVYTTAYLHLMNFAKGVQAGQFVKQGDLIGHVGSTGLSTGAHLDFRFYKNGQPINPLKVEAPSVEPVRDENKADFDSVKAVALQMLSEF